MMSVVPPASGGMAIQRLPDLPNTCGAHWVIRLMEVQASVGPIQPAEAQHIGRNLGLFLNKPIIAHFDNVGGENRLPIRHELPLLKNVMSDIDQVMRIRQDIVQVLKIDRKCVIDRMPIHIYKFCVGKNFLDHANIKEVVRSLICDQARSIQISRFQKILVASR